MVKKIKDSKSKGPGPVRILVIGLYNSRGGTETSTMNYYRHLNHDNIQYDFINPYKGFYFRDEITALGGKVYDVASFRASPIKYFMDVYKIIRKHDYKIVNVVMLSAVNPLPVIVAYLARVPNIIVHSHNTSVNGRLKKLLHYVNKPIVNILSNYHWACSSEAGKWLFYRKSKLVYNAIDLDTYKYSDRGRIRVRQEFNIGTEIVIGNVARLASEKNQGLLLDILSEVHDTNNEVVLLLVGDGPMKESLIHQAERLGISDKVIFAGDRSDVADLYSSFDVFVLPSLYEGLPMVGIEAQAAGTPVVCSDIVTQEMNVNKEVHYISLEAPVSVWKDAILASSRMSSDISAQLLTEGGYNIKKEARSVEDFYMSISLPRLKETVI